MKLLLTLAAKEAGVSRALKQMEDNIKRTATAAVQESEKAGRAQENIIRRTERENRQASAARARLGVRSERDIQREILRTQQAYTALSRSGKASQNELQRAAKASRLRIRELNEELGRSSKLQKGMQIGGAAIAATAAAGAVLKPAMDDQKQLQANVTQVAWQAFGEDNTKSADWIATKGKKQIKDLVTQLVRENGGNADVGLDLINSMMANGMSFNEAKSSSRESYKAMIASAERPGQYNPEDTAKLMKVLSDYGFKNADLGQAFEHAMKSGMQGNFEIADMVRELPALLPAAKSSGLSGMQGFDYLLSMLQSSSNKAGSNSEAANNIRNLLEKTLSADTTKRLKKMAHPTEPGKGIDWQGSVLKGAGNGENAVEVLARLADTMLARDKEYQSLKLKADGGDKTAANQMNIMKGFVLSSLLPDIQAKAGLNAAVDSKQMQEYIQGLLELKPADSLVKKNIDVKSRDDLFKQERDTSLAMLGRSDTTDPLNNLQSKWTAFTAEFPNATLALTALAAAATAASGALGLMALMGGGKGAVGGILKGGASTAGQVLKGGASKVGGLLKWGGRMLGGGGRFLLNSPKLGMGGFGAGLLFHSESLNAGEDERMRKMRMQNPQVRPPLSAEAIRRQQQQQALGGGQAGKAATGQPPQLPVEKMQPMFIKQTADFQAAMQTNTATLGGQLDRINGTLASQQQTIQNNISVTLDGRVVAEQVSRQQYSMFNRGGAQ
ncbi:phage tail tape measure protein [Snodgrassella sp. CFCC 13594]|uniref:phage tail tape measure protein n=1 Tax=Snodgrassella sp. CFCC 13594 TaxID=1775559 RepID=UPI001E3A023D|nr:phage tail tape measure protein [Snodgrassella sp. CFCC 13594]